MERLNVAKELVILGETSTWVDLSKREGVVREIGQGLEEIICEEVIDGENSRIKTLSIFFNLVNIHKVWNKETKIEELLYLYYLMYT